MKTMLKKSKRTSVTGLNIRPLEDFNFVLKGGMFVIPPADSEYEGMTLSDLNSRIIFDMFEMASRAKIHPDWSDDYSTAHAPRLLKDTPPDPRLAISILASVTQKGVELLENLSVTHPEIFRDAAKGHSQWPVNLGVEKKLPCCYI